MSTARKVLMIIAFVVSIIGTIVFALCATVFFISMNNEEILIRVLDGLNRKSVSLKDGKLIVTAFGIIFAILAFLELINAFLSIKGRKSNRPGLMVINIIFGVLSGIYINSLGGIFGLVDSNKQ